jgi:8-oxo-dGTP pyrophosphatase MutT (NUDIX family)
MTPISSSDTEPSPPTGNQPFAVGTEVMPNAQTAEDLSIPPDTTGIVEELHPAGYWTAVRWSVQSPSMPNGWLVNHPPGVLLRRDAQPPAAPDEATAEAAHRALEQFPDAEIVDGRVLVGVLVVERGGEFAAVLVRKRGWRTELPSGKAMVGESAVDAAAREGREELGVPVRIVGHVGDYDHEAYGLRWRVSTFAGALVDGDRLVGSAEGPARWVSRDEITDRPPGDDLPARILAGYDAWAAAREAT